MVFIYLHLLTVEKVYSINSTQKDYRIIMFIYNYQGKTKYQRRFFIGQLVSLGHLLLMM